MNTGTPQIAVTGLIRNAAGQILMVHSPLRQVWELPGGQVEPGEIVIDALHREIREETGVAVEIDRLCAVHHNLSKNILIFGFAGRYLSGGLRPSEESDDIRWMDAATLEAQSLRPVMKARLEDLIDPSTGVAFRTYTTEPFVVEYHRRL